MRIVIKTPDAPTSPLYSQAIKTSSEIYVSGTIGADPRTQQLPATIGDQTRQALRNCEAILRAADASLADVVEVGVSLARPNDFTAFNESYSPFFPTDPPTRYVAGNGRRVLTPTRTLRIDPSTLEEIRTWSSRSRPCSFAAVGDDFGRRIGRRCHDERADRSRRRLPSRQERFASTVRSRDLL